MSDGHLKALYVFGHILNRLKLLEAQVFGHWNTFHIKKADSAQSSAAEFGVIESILLLAGELKEAWEAIQSCYHGSKLSKDLNGKLSDSTKDALKRIPIHCSRDGVIYKLRNNFAYHHSPDVMLDEAKKLDSADQHSAHIFDGGNTFFCFAADLRILAIATVLEHGDLATLSDHLVEKVAKDAFVDVSTVLTEILTTILSEVSIGTEDRTLDGIPSSVEITADYFFHI